MSHGVVALARTVRGFIEARRLGRLPSREALREHQQRRIELMRTRLLPRSAFYAPYASEPFERWPTLSKAQWMQNFDSINTVGLELRQATEVAARGEASRDFRPTLRGCAVGFSTGTSGSRGLFIASAAERAFWAGVMLSKLVPRWECKPLRVALLLRANSALYESLGLGPVRFRFFDLTRPFEEVLRAVAEFDCTVLVAPAHVLSTLARSPIRQRLAIRPRRVISVAEVLEEIDRAAIEGAFGVRVEQIYQATEGFLGATCPHGTLHLNEEYVVFEPEWLDASQTRFVPLITDLYRTSQPVIRYRLDDVLVVRSRERACPCGSPLLALERIEGREGDVLWLPSASATRPNPGSLGIRTSDFGPQRAQCTAVPVFADVIARVLVRAVPDIQDYSVDEIGSGRWRVGLQPPLEREVASRLRRELNTMAAGLGAVAPEVQFGEPIVTAAFKRRRIRGQGALCRPS